MLRRCQGRSLTRLHPPPAQRFQAVPPACCAQGPGSSCLQRGTPPPHTHTQRAACPRTLRGACVDVGPVLPALRWLCAGSALAAGTRDEAVGTSSPLLPTVLLCTPVWASHSTLIQCGPRPRPREQLLSGSQAAPGVQLALWSEQDGGPCDRRCRPLGREGGRGPGQRWSPVPAGSEPVPGLVDRVAVSSGV